MSSSAPVSPLDKFRKARFFEGIFRWLLSGTGVLMLLLLGAIFLTLLFTSLPAIKANGFHFLIGSTWDPVGGHFGALPFMAGTLFTSILALIISFPFSIALAILLGEFFRNGPIAEIFRNVLELMAGVPSVIYGFAALYFLTPAIRVLEVYSGIPPYGVGVLTASIVLSIMILPYWASVAREVISLTSKDLKEAAYSLGSTRYEVIKLVVIPNTRTGIIAGMLLAFGRAIGETMAVTMVIGNTNAIPHSIFSPANTMASVIANEFTEATTHIYLSSLIEIALLLFLISVLINIIGKQIIKRLSH
jgi:phosphate transport system permease protein